MQKRLFWLTFLAFSGCEQLLFVEVEIPNLCQELVNQSFDAMPQAGDFTVDREFDYPISMDLDLGEGFVGAAQLKRLLLMPGPDTQKLDFIRYAHVELRGAEASGLPPVNLLDFDQNTNTRKDGSIELTGDAVNIMPYVQSGSLKLKASLSGQLPTQAWSTHIQTCISAKAHVPYWNFVQNAAQGTAP